MPTYWIGEMTHAHRELPSHETKGFKRRTTWQEALNDAVERRSLSRFEYGDGLETYAYEYRDGERTGNYVDADEDGRGRELDEWEAKGASHD